MRVGILGALAVDGTAGPVEIGGARLRALLIRLALDVGRPVSAAALAAALWEDDPPTDPANAVQSLMSRLRRVLPVPAVLRSGPDGYRLDLPPEAVDAVRFERLATEGRRALRAADVTTAVSRLREACDLWRGPALADVAGARYAAAPAARLAELRLAASEDLVEARFRAGRPDGLVAELAELVAAHPLRERPRSLLMRVLYATGRRAEATAAFEELRGRLADELGVDPSPELRALHVAMLRGEWVPPAAYRTPPGNLRQPRASFVGRAEELARIGQQLGDGRLVTLVGPGGAGKTRLATTFAAGAAGTVPGGAWLVELAPVTDPDDVLAAVVGALGLRESATPGGPRDPLGRLVVALSPAETLLVLDNCEHVIDAAARLADELLGRCPRLRVLATSREPLGIPGEALCPVPPLGLPAPGASVAEAVACPAVRLFADRVAAVRPGFAVTADNVAAVVEVARRLDGLPLAIELAAARLRALTVPQLLARLDDRFQVLTGGHRTALPRHRTLAAVVAWSWDLLTGAERRLAEQLAVFPGTITPEAAARVCPPAGDLVTALVDKSLLQVVDGPEPRYAMLETIREYGVQRLAETGGLAAARAAHAAYFRDLAERAEAQLRTAAQVPWIGRLVAERDNLTAALRYGCDVGDADTAVRLGAALGLFWTVRGSHAEAASWLRAVLAVAGTAPPETRTVATVFHLFNGVLAGDPDRAAPIDTPASGHPAAALIGPVRALVDDDAARGVAGIDRLLSHPEPWTRGMLWLLRAFFHGNTADVAAMRQDLAAAAEEFGKAGERWGRATALTYLGFVDNMTGDFDAAIGALDEAVLLLGELDPADGAAMQRTWIADAYRRKGDVDRARDQLLAMVAPGTGAARPATAARIALGDLARDGGDLTEAARWYAEAAGDLDRAAFPDPALRAMLDAARGQAAVAGGDLAAARRHLGDALTVATDAPDMPMVAIVAVGVAHLCLRRGAASRAAEVLGAAHALRGNPDGFNPDVVRLAARLHDELGERGYRAEYDRGRDLDRSAALALIRAEAARP
jgi:predicted ATPase/DNA-binding SARP family transcriptional activator